MLNHKLVIIEGTSTSGKTTLMQLLTDHFNSSGYSSLGFDEAQTLTPEIFSNPNSVKSLEFIRSFLDKKCSSDDTIIVCDRFHLSNLAISNGSIEDLNSIEPTMKQYDPLLVFLRIPDESIRNRLLDAKVHRRKEWNEELYKRGKTEDETIAWFKGTQHKLYNLFLKSTLAKVEFNVEDMSYVEIASELAKKIIQISSRTA